MSASVFNYDAAQNAKTNTFTKTGYTFDGWSLTANGNRAYTDGASIKNIITSGSTTLYAKWTANVLIVNYDANGGSGTMTSSYLVYDYEGSTAQENGFTRTGYTFSGWNSKQDGTGTNYAAGGSITNIVPSGTTTLYAMWTPNVITVEYNPNGGSGTMSASSFSYDETQTAKSNIFTKTGYHFTGWAKTAGGSAEINDNGSIQNIVSEGTQNLYAKWAANTYTVNYNANGGSGTTASTSATYDSDVTLSASSFTKSGSVFAGWMTSQNSNTIYKAGTALQNLTAENGGNVTLFAKWASLTLDSVALGGDSTDAVPNDGWDSREVTSVSVVKDETTTSATAGGAALDAKYGTVALKTDGKLEYTPTSMTWGNSTDEEINVNITNELDGVTYSNNESTVNIYPQTNILFNENSDATVTLAGETGTVSGDTLSNGWVDVTDNTVAATSTASNAYGYSDVYGKNAKYSGGSAKKATVTNLTSNSSTYNFTFTGTGVDIYAACDKDSGLMIVTLQNAETRARVGMNTAINLYYASNDSTIYQAPVYHKTGLDYGTYNVYVTVAYSYVFDCTDNDIAQANANATEEDFANAFADMGFDPDEIEYYAVADGENLTDDIPADVTPSLDGVHNPVEDNPDECTGDYSVTIDSIRIYNPAGTTDELPTAIADRYSSDGELGAQYLNFRDFITADNYSSCYVVGSGSAASFEQYKKNGAKNEVMLNSGADAVSCTIDGFEEGGKVHISLRSPFANAVVANFGNGNTITIGTSTEQYYDITDFVDEDGEFTVACSGGILSVCNLKYIPAQAETVTLTSTPVNLAMAAALIEEVAVNPVPEAQDVTFTIDFAGETQEITIPASSFLYEMDGDNWTVTCTLDKETVIELYEKTGLTDDYSLVEGSIKLTATWDGENWVADDVTAPVNTPEPVTPDDPEEPIENDTDNVDDTDNTADTEDTQSFSAWIKKVFEIIRNFFKNIVSAFSFELI